MYDNICPICDEGNTTIQVEKIEVEYRGKKGFIQTRAHVCDKCGEETVGAIESKFNKRAFFAFKKEIDGLLSGTEIKRIRRHYGLTQAAAGKFLGGGKIAFNKYENDDVAQSEAMDNLLRVIDLCPDAYLTLERIKGIMVDSYSIQSRHINLGSKFKTWGEQRDTSVPLKRKKVASIEERSICILPHHSNDNSWIGIEECLH